MPFFAMYLLKLSISLSAAWLFYQLFLRRLTFYNWNRWYLLGYSLLSFFIPLINVAAVIKSNPENESPVIRYIPVIGNYKPAGLGAWDLVLGALVLGSAVLLLRLFARWLSLRRIRGRARLIGGEVVGIYQVDEPIIPFSFGNAIYINQHLHTEKEWSSIILHEYVHIRQRHTVDILLAELSCILNWYNPFAWLMRYSIRQNLEFIADSKVLENGLDKKGYQYHLLKVVGEPRYRLANNFNFSSLKKRIIMMNKIRSTRLQLVKFMFVLPLFAVLLVAFRDQYKQVLNFSPVRPASSAAVSQSPGLSGRAREYDHALARITDQAGPLSRADRSAHITDTLPSAAGTDTSSFRIGNMAVQYTRSDGTTDTVVKPVEYRVKPVRAIAIATDTFIVHTDYSSPWDGNDVLYILDGKELKKGDLNQVNPNSIASINILKGEQAVDKYGEKGKNGVVEITNKDYFLKTHPGEKLPSESRPASRRPVDTAGRRSPGDSTVVLIRGNAWTEVRRTDSSSPRAMYIQVIPGDYKGLVFVDGKEISWTEVKKIVPQKIASMDVLKGDSAVKAYGDRAKDGVILITLKK